jgi:hypothetical protein
MSPSIRLRNAGLLCPAVIAVVGLSSVARSAGPANAAAGGWFTDVAPRSSFAYKTNNDYTGRKYFPQPMAGGVAIFDFNNDGKMDIFLTNGAKLPELEKVGSAYDNALLRNNGDGTFTDVSAKAGLIGKQTGYAFGVAAADYDNDGFEDLFVASAGRNTLYHNNGDGTFTDVTDGSGLEHKAKNVLSVGAAWFDMDNDGLLDLIVTNYTVWDPKTDRPCLQEPGHVPYYCSPQDVIAVAPSLYRNLGHGKFKDVTEESGIGSVLGKGMGVSIADFNGDGLPDLFISNDTIRNFLYINQGGGKFSEEAVPYGVAYSEMGGLVSGMGSDAGDIDNDGFPDIIRNDLATQLFSVYRNTGGHSFDDVTTQTGLGRISRLYSGWGLGFIDYDNDGWPDIFSANGDVDDLKADSRQHDTMFRNAGGTRLVDATSEMGKDFGFVGFQRGASFGDLNNDGFEDIVVTSLGQKPRILMNRALNGNDWITLDLRGTRSNRDGLGASVKLTTGSGRVLYNYATTSVGLMSSKDRRVHFGLGVDTGIKVVEVRWPSGVVQRMEGPAANQILKVVEPAS